MKKLQIMFKTTIQVFLLAAIVAFFSQCQDSSKINALVIADNEEVAKSLETILENSGLFSADVNTTASPKFSKYNVVVLDLVKGEWDEETKANYLAYVKEGGASVLIGGSAFAFGDWAELSEVAGTPTSAGLKKSTDGFEYVVSNLKKDNPITTGLPQKWTHAKDYLVLNTANITGQTEVLATAWADTLMGGDGAHLPVMAAIAFGQGRVFHTTLGSNANAEDLTALQCVGFITVLQRGAEWAANGVVSQTVPIDFPSSVSTHDWVDYKPLTIDETLAKSATYEIGKSTKYLQDFTMMIRKSDGTAATYAMYEDKILTFMSSQASVESKKYMCRQLSWMGSEKSVAALEKLVEDKDLAESAQYALTRIKQ